MSSDEKNREVYQDEEDGLWYYSAPAHLGYANVYVGPFDTEEQATEAMRLHGLEE
jgi:hypothetical protein